MRTDQNIVSPRLRTSLASALLAFVSVGSDAVEPDGVVASEPAQVRIAFSKGVIGEINTNDAKASIMAWGGAMMNQRDVQASVVPLIFDRGEDLLRGVMNGEIDAVVRRPVSDLQKVSDLLTASARLRGRTPALVAGKSLPETTR